MTNTEFAAPIRALCAEYAMLPKGEPVLCAVSGGMDSMALLHVLLSLRETLGFLLYAAHFNHKLRGDEAERDATFVASYCREHNIPFLLGEGDVAKEAENQRCGIEETARSMRYAFLEDAAKEVGATRILTAHHADDNVETLLLHLVRGTGLRGLTGIPPVRGMIARPLLATSRLEISEYVQQNQLPFVEDSSNKDDSFARNRLRHNVLPVLKEMNPNLIHALSGTVRSLREDQVYLEARALELFRKAHRAEDGMVIATNCLAMEPKALAVRVIIRMLEEIEASAPSQVHLNGIIEIAQGSDPSAALHLPGGILVQRVYGDILIAWDWEHEPLPPLPATKLSLHGVTEIGTWQVNCRELLCPVELPNEQTIYLDAQKICMPLLLRSRQTGDMLALPGRRRKTLKKLLIEQKVPRRVREQLPVLADRDGVIAVAGIGPERTRLAMPGEPAYELSFVQRDTETRKDAMQHGEGY
jgi:tRNA(Ile)-lysidine synthase